MTSDTGQIFCISLQRNGTTSTGKFFADHGFRVATYPVSARNGWTARWFRGDYEGIFATQDFQGCQVFEDDPWWCGDFYKFLFHRFPAAQFVHLHRDPKEWFASLRRHSKGKTPGNGYIHSRLYHRHQDYDVAAQGAAGRDLFDGSVDNRLDLGESQEEHYIDFYNARTLDVMRFFERFGRDRLFSSDLNQPQKWQKMGRFFGFSVPEGYVSHENRSTQG